MVFARALDSPLFVDADGKSSSSSSERCLRRLGTNLTLKDLLSPIRKQSPASVRDSLKDAYDHLGDFKASSSSQQPSYSSIIVDRQHQSLRTTRGKRSPDVPQTDIVSHEQTPRLPKLKEKFGWNECSGGLDRFNSTTSLSESFKDSSSVSRCEPLMAPCVLSESSTSSTPSEVRKQFQAASSIKAPTALAHKSLPLLRFNSCDSNCSTTMSSPQTLTGRNARSQKQRRSRSIAIKSSQWNRSNSNGSSASQLELAAVEEESVLNERMYDWATWRMYNRIVDHRRNQGLSASSSSFFSMGQSGSMQCSSADSSLYSYGGVMNATLDGFSASDYIHDGEVFELEI